MKLYVVIIISYFAINSATISDESTSDFDSSDADEDILIPYCRRSSNLGGPVFRSSDHKKSEFNVQMEQKSAEEMAISKTPITSSMISCHYRAGLYVDFERCSN